MDQNNNWREIGQGYQEVIKKINNGIDKKDIADDIKESLKSTIQNTSDILNSILGTIEKTVNDNEIKEETRSLVKQFDLEVKKLIKSISENKKNKFYNHFLEEE